MAFRLLQVGLGNRGRQWLEIIAALPEIALVGVVDTDPARIAAFAADHGDIPVRFDLASGLRDFAADAVLLVTPPDGHLEQARAVFAAGLPLLAEKPLASDLSEAAAIVRLAKEHRLPLSVGLNFRYLPVTRALKALIAQGRFGAPGFGQFSYRRNRDGRQPRLNKYPLTMRDPMMLEQSIHHLDLIRFAYGREVEAVSCRSWNPPWSMYAHDANVACLMTLEGGLEVSYLGTWTGGWNELAFEWRTDCAGGVIVQRELFGDLAVAATGDASLAPVMLEDGRPFLDDSRLLLRDFVAALGAGTVAPCDGADHLRSLALCFAAIESSKTGRRVDLATFHTQHGLDDVL